jgi:hypothetical protein
MDQAGQAQKGLLQLEAALHHQYVVLPHAKVASAVALI